MLKIQLKILIIDDSPEDREIYKRLLQSEKNFTFKFFDAETAEEATELLKSQTPDCILLDYKLPDKNGIEFLREIKQNNEYNEIPVIILTGQGDETVAVRAIRNGAGDYLVKDRLNNELISKSIYYAIERQRKEIELKETRNRYKYLVENANDIIYETNIEGDCTYINPIATKLLGYENKEFIGKNYLDFVHPDNRDEMKKNFQEQYRTKQSMTNTEIHVIKKDGSDSWISQTTQLLIENDMIFGFQAIARDITKRKIAEEKLKISEEILRKKNDARDCELVYAQNIINGLLPSEAPVSEFLEVRYRYIPLEVVGGDFFSFTSFREGELGIFLGDVEGHGIPAALFLSLVKSVTDETCRQYGREPKKYLQQLNSEMYRNMESSFLTAIYGYFKKTEDKINFVFSRAGHTAPILYRSDDKSFKLVKSSGALAGIFEDIDPEEISIDLNTGDRLFIYTDGLIEASDSNRIMLDDEGLKKIIEENNHHNLDITLNSIIGSIDEYRGKIPFEDDIVIIGFEVI